MYAVLLLLILNPGLCDFKTGQIPEREASKAEMAQAKEKQPRIGEQAKVEARRQVFLNPGSAEAHFALADTLIHGPIRAEDYDEILEEYLTAIRLKPDYAEAYFRLGLFYAEKDKYEQGYKALNKAISLKPDYGEAYCALGFAYIQKKFDGGRKLPLTEKETAMAVKAFKKATEIRPDLLQAYFGLGEANLYRKQYNESLEAFRRAIALDPNEVMSHVGIAAVYIELGDKDAAVQQYTALSRLATEFEAALKDKGSDSHINIAKDNADRLLKEIGERFREK